MSIEALSQLEEKVQSAVETMSLYRLEIEELREAKARAEKELEEVKNTITQLEEEKQIMQQEQQSWNDKVGSLLSKLEDIEQEEVA